MNKQTLTILIVAVVLVAALLIFENPFKGERPSRWREEEKVQLITPISEEECSRIELSGFGTTATLVRKDRQWFTHDGYKADPDAIAPLFKIVGDLGQGEPELISINPDAFMKFRVDPFLGTRLKMMDPEGKARVDLIIGELQNDFFHTPVRKPDSNKVFLIRAMFRGVLQRPTWRDQNIFRFDAQALRRVTVHRPDESYAIMQEATTSPWHFCEPTSAPVDMQQVQSWVWRVARLRATDLQATTSTDMLTTFGLTTPTARLSITLDNGSSYTLAFGGLDPKTNQYYAKRIDDPQIYRIDQRTYTDILRKSDELKPKPAIPTPTEALTTPTTPSLISPKAPPSREAQPRPTTGTARLTPPARMPKAPTPPPAVSKGTPPKDSTTSSLSPATLKKAPPKKATPAAPPRPGSADKPTTKSVAK
jgi:hypothetical protein